MSSLLSTEQSVETLLRRGLDWLGRLARFDLATLFVLEEGRLVAVAARGPLATPEVRRHSLTLADFPSLQEALETRRARAFTEEDHAHGDGDPFDGVLDLPAGHACMVVPLCAGEKTYGLLTLDRRECETYPAEVVNLVEVFGQMLAAALQSAEQRAEAERLHQQDHLHAKQLEARGGAGAFLERSQLAAVRDLVARAREVASTASPVLLTGERGTGKARLAHAIHQWSARVDEPFVTVACAALTPERAEVVLFDPVQGQVELARGGTLYLQDVERLSLEAQDRVAELKDVRLVASGQGDLPRSVEGGRFRESLYYRLSVASLALPPLRERMEDLPMLVSLLLVESGAPRGTRVTKEGLARLAGYGWPGNLSELALVLERAALLSGKPELGADVLVLPRSASPARTLAQVQREHIEEVLARTEGRIYGEGGAAELLGLKPSTLQSKMKKLGIDR